MECRKCGTPLARKDAYCPSCGAKNTAKKKKKREYVIVRKSPWVIIFAVLLLLIMGAGIWYSSTDSARFVGNWKCERPKDLRAEEKEYVRAKIELQLFGKATEITAGNTYHGTYSLKANKLTTVRSEPKATVVEPYQFLGANTLIIGGREEHPVSRTDVLPFYVVVIGVSALLGFIGAIMLIKQKKRPISIKEKKKTEPLPKKEPVSKTPPVREPLAGTHSGETAYKTETYTPPSTSELFAKASMAEPTTDSHSAYKSRLISSDLSDTSASSGKSRLKSTMKKADEGHSFTATFSTIESSMSAPTMTSTVAPSDSEHMEQAGDL